MKKIAVIHATKISIEPVEAAARSFPQVQLLHLVDEGMSGLARREGRISGRNMARMAVLLQQAQALEADGILLSCTIFSPYIETLRQLVDVPLVAADIGVFEKAAMRYRHVGAVVSFPPTMQSVRAVVDHCREQINPAFTAELRLAEGAFEALAAGAAQKHNQLLYETACGMVEGKEAIVLSQMSHMRALPLIQGFPVPVLTSPPVSLELLCGQIEQKGKSRG